MDVAVFELLFRISMENSPDQTAIPQINQERLRPSLGLIYKSLKIHTNNIDKKTRKLYGIDGNIKLYSKSKVFFTGLGFQYLANSTNEHIEYTNLYLPIGMDLYYFGVYYVIGLSAIDGLYNEEISGRNDGLYCYLNFDEYSFHFGVSNLKMTKDTPPQEIEYTGSSYTISLQYTF